MSQTASVSTKLNAPLPPPLPLVRMVVRALTRFSPLKLVQPHHHI